MPKPYLISGSRGAAVLGLNKYQTQLEAWQLIMEDLEPQFNQKSGFVLPAAPDNAAIRWGRAFEDSIIYFAEIVANREITNREKMFATDGKSYSSGSFLQSDYHFITCHMDGQYSDSILHEGKTTTALNFKYFGEPGTDRVPREYQIQCQHQMLCAQADLVILSVLVFPKSPDEWEKSGLSIRQFSEGEAFFIEDRDSFEGWGPYLWTKTLFEMGFFHQYKIYRNEELICKMVEKYSHFWYENILKKTPPTPLNIDDIIRLTPEPSGTIILDDQAASWYNEYKTISQEIGPAGMMGKRKDELRALILASAMKSDNKVFEDESKDKWIFLDRTGKKIGSFSKNKNGNFIFR